MHPRLYVKKIAVARSICLRSTWTRKENPSKIQVLISGPNGFEQQEARYHGFVVYTRIKSRNDKSVVSRFWLF